jgi:hypothetical protein
VWYPGKRNGNEGSHSQGWALGDRIKPWQRGENMNKGRLIGGIICLAIAGLLAVLIFALPEGDVIFMIGDRNMPWIPVIGLAGVGAALVGTAPWGQRA